MVWAISGLFFRNFSGCLLDSSVKVVACKVVLPKWERPQEWFVLGDKLVEGRPEHSIRPGTGWGWGVRTTGCRLGIELE